MPASPFIDLRSDTVTRPSPGMREAMARAVVGDDVLDDDPTIHALQERAAEIMGKEAALFMPSGTMSNVAAIKVHTQPGDEILLDSQAHTMLYEAGNAALVAGVMTRQFHSAAGVPPADELPALVKEETLHSPRTSLLVLENTHNRAGGAVTPLAIHRRIFEAMRERGASVHLDGARVFNAAIALGVPAAEIAELTDSVTFCLSKGLGCPVGSVLCGSRAFVERARRVRKMLGGGMRQAGVLAAAGLYALDHNVARLAEDHANARRLASAIAAGLGLVVETEPPASNMVYMRTQREAAVFVRTLKERYGVLASVMGPHTVRAVTHLDVTTEQIDRAAEAMLLVARQCALA
ncbi:MAG TPA: low-specificity L-threonine aldolase [Chthonomonadaceae bacterium]|nr:low-specificity L-threonine aldolase [Chthonomonadaceae bacterium]